jgi:hypothetical protein
MSEESTDHRIGLFDLDGTLANYEKAMRYWLDLLKAPGELDYPVHSGEPKYYYQRQCVIRRQPGFWLGLEPIELGFEVLNVAQEVGFRNFHACTRGPSNCSSAWSEKFDWVQAYKSSGRLPRDMKITITEDKGTVYGRFLCDDHVPYLQRWLAHRKRGLAILVAPPGIEVPPRSLHPQIIQYDGSNRDELRHWLAKAYERKPGEPL